MTFRCLQVALILFLSIELCHGRKLLIHQQNVELTIPVSNNFFKTLDVHPIWQIKVSELQGNGSSTLRFRWKRSSEFLFLRINDNGEIFFDRTKWPQQKQVSTNAIVKDLETGATAQTSLTFNFVTTKKREFCLQHSCFYDKIQYKTTEFKQNARSFSKKQIIGDLSPPLYRLLCDDYKTVYFLENGTNYVDMSRNDELVKQITMDFENMEEPRIVINITCELKDKNFQEDLAKEHKLIDITVVDRNDNHIFVDNDSINVEILRYDPEFTEGDIVNRSSIIMFHDKDSVSVNNHFEIKINDSHNMFRHDCNVQTWIDGRSSVIICSIFFTCSGRLDQSSYCFQLKTFDVSQRRKAQATSNICVKPVLRTMMELPETNHKMQDTSTALNSNKPIDYQPEAEKLYPDEVQILQRASDFSRVVQPLINTDNVGFVLTANPFGAFNITSKGGIIYIAQSNLLAKALPTSSIKLEVSWKEHRKQQINVIFRLGNTSCSHKSSICSIHDNPVSCESSCGVGSNDGRCKWREHQGSELISKIFSTCVSDLNYCGNQICDPLEAFYPSICPQDCSKQVVGNVNTQAMGISGSSKANVCTCDESENCVCGPPKGPEASLTETPTTPSTSTTAFIDINPQYDECDDQCKAQRFGLSFGFFLLLLFSCCFARSHFRRVPFNSIESPIFSEGQLIRVRTLSNESSRVRFEELDETQQYPGNHDFFSKAWEVDMTNVKVERNIGEGEFGKVMLASMATGNHDGDRKLVVIKTVKDVENESEMTCLKKEFEQLKKVSVHPHVNVINLLGCCSKGSTPLIFLEFCVFESLKDYLLASRLIPSRTGSDGVDKVSTEDILRFSLQISTGMAHLSLLKLVHRDLAARNVLLSEGKICKISDFGLTRNVCKTCDTYSKCSDDKVPVKWLAPESLSANEEYTTKSDVWAFGILGYELIMLGSSPYPDIATNHLKILSLLLKGYKMKCPSNCKTELFDIYESCWELDPTRRPTFDELVKKFQEQILQTSIKNQQELWTTPEFPKTEYFDDAYYKEYILRVEQARLYYKPSSSRKRKIFNRTSDRTKKLLSLNSIDNDGYDSNFDALKSMMIRQTQQETNSNPTISMTTGSSSSFATSSNVPRYLSMISHAGSTSMSTNNIIEKTQRNSESSGYVSMDGLMSKTLSCP